MKMKLNVHGLTMKYEACNVLEGAEFAIRPGELVALLGANGSGKTTLLRCISRILDPTAGVMYLDGQDIQKFTAREMARRMAVVPQETALDFDFSVEEVVLMGRFSHLGRFQKEGEKEKELARAAMEMTGVAHLAGRSAATLSGGEKQRVMIARALCQEPELLLLDEPTANLDLGYQSELLDLAVKLNRQKKVTVMAAIHDLNLATQFFNRFILLAGGRVLAAGRAEEVITVANIRASYGVPAAVFRHPLHGRLQVSVLKKRKKARGRRVHVIAGGLEALPVLEFLREQGCRLSLGPVTREDSCYQFACLHRLPAVEVPLFSPLSDEAQERHIQLLAESELLVIPPIPFGVGNMRHLEAAEEALRRGLEVLLLDAGDIKERDFTGGQAAEALKRLERQGALPLTGMEELKEKLHKGGGGGWKNKGAG